MDDGVRVCASDATASDRQQDLLQQLPLLVSLTDCSNSVMLLNQTSCMKQSCL